MAMILGLDLGSRLSGWCAGDGAGIPAVDAWDFSPIGNASEGWDYGFLLAQLEDRLNILIGRVAVDVVVYEAPIHVPKGDSRPYGDTLHKMRLLYSMGAFLEWWCRRRDLACFEVQVAEIKREVTGDRFAEKDDLVETARNCGLNLPHGESAKDAADAWGAWLLGVRAYDPLRSAEWDSRIRTSRGALL